VRGDVFDTFSPNTPLANRERERERGIGEKEEKRREEKKDEYLDIDLR